MNAVEREAIETRVLNPNTSEASYKPKQRSYRKTNKKKVLVLNGPGAEMSGAEMSSAETYPTPFISLNETNHRKLLLDIILLSKSLVNDKRYITT